MVDTWMLTVRSVGSSIKRQLATKMLMRSISNLLPQVSAPFAVMSIDMIVTSQMSAAFQGIEFS